MDDWTYTVEHEGHTTVYEVQDWQNVPVLVDAFGQGEPARGSEVSTIVSHTGWSPGIRMPGVYVIDTGKAVVDFFHRSWTGEWEVTTYVPFGTGTYRELTINSFPDLVDACEFIGLFR